MDFKPKILVVEDDGALLRLLGSVLEEMGAEPRLVPSSPHAAELVEREKFDGVFLDYKMPEMDGLELAQRIRRSKSNSRAPIVMLSGVLGATSLERNFKAGVSFFLQKPVTVAQLRNLLNASRGAMLAERRRYQRAPARLKMRCRWSGVQEVGQSLNLSATGALLSLEEPPAEKAEVTLEIFLPGHREPLEVAARVARVTPGPAPGEQSGRGVGLEFKSLTPQQRQLLTDFVEKTLESLSSSP